jgi:predicted CoA-binding protein
VAPFELTEKIVKQCIQKGITRVWMQPGAESEAAINFCNENNIKVVHNVCMILQK